MRQRFGPVRLLCLFLVGGAGLAIGQITACAGLGAGNVDGSIQLDRSCSPIRIFLTDRRSVAAFDLKNGRILWSAPSPGGTIEVGPVVAGNTVIVVGDGAFTTAFGMDAATGRVKWHVRHRSSLLAPCANLIYFNSQILLGITAVNANSGLTIWKHEIGAASPHEAFQSLANILCWQGKVYTDTGVYEAKTGALIRSLGPETAIAASGNTVYLVSESNELSAVNTGSGAARWTVKLPPERTVAGLSAAGGTVAVSVYNGDPWQAHSGEIFVYDAGTGARRFVKEIYAPQQGLPAGLVSTNGGLILATLPIDRENATVEAWSASTGAVRWSRRISRFFLGAPFALPGAVVLTSTRGTAVVLDSNSGKILREFGISPSSKEPKTQWPPSSSRQAGDRRR